MFRDECMWCLEMNVSDAEKWNALNLKYSRVHHTKMPENEMLMINFILNLNEYHISIWKIIK